MQIELSDYMIPGNRYFTWMSDIMPGLCVVHLYCEMNWALGLLISL